MPAEAFLAAVRETAERLELLPHLLQALEKVRVPGLGEALLDLYLRLPGRLARPPGAGARSCTASEVLAALDTRRDVSDADRLVLAALLGKPLDEVALAILDLDAVVPSGGDLPADADRGAGDAAPLGRLAGGGARALLGPRRRGGRALRAVGDAARPARPRRGDALGAADPRPGRSRRPRGRAGARRAASPSGEELRDAILESLGRIGGPEARAVLQFGRPLLAGRSTEARTAFKALAACAGPGDDVLFRAAAVHPDWQVRLVAAEVLGRFQGPESSLALTRLAADSVPAVAHRALASLEN